MTFLKRYYPVSFSSSDLVAASLGHDRPVILLTGATAFQEVVRLISVSDVREVVLITTFPKRVENIGAPVGKTFRPPADAETRPVVFVLGTLPSRRHHRGSHIFRAVAATEGTDDTECESPSGSC